MKNKNSLLFWYPKICHLGIKTPQTDWLLLNDKEKKEYWEGDSCNVARINQFIKCFNPPIFVRTDQASNKWMWQKSCYIENYDNLNSQIFEIICMNRIADMMGLPIEAIVVREYIPMAEKFRAFYGMPVNPERRYFIYDGKVLCHHPYWIESSIKFFNIDEPENWKHLLKEANDETKEEIELLSFYASQIAEVMEGYWSVDFCLSQNGEWILIDMANGYESWHPDCVKKKEKIYERHIHEGL